MANAQLRTRESTWWRKWGKKHFSIAAAGFTILSFALIVTFDSSSSWTTTKDGDDSKQSSSSTITNPASLVKLTLLPNAKLTGAVCLDGSSPGYHFQKGFGSGADSWVLHIEGGGWCSSVESCSSRQFTALGSSNSMDHGVPFSGMLSQEASQNPDGVVKDFISFNNQQLTLNLHLRRHLFDWEIERINGLWDIIGQVVLTNDDDRLSWEDGSMVFTVQKAYSMVTRNSSSRANFPAKKIWINLIPSRVCFFLWLVSIKKILTIDNLKKRGFQIVNWCVLCHQQVETCDHIFRECSFFHCIWVGLTSSFNGCLGQEGTVRDAIELRSCNTISEAGLLIWRGLIHALWWNIWAERNRRIFEDKDEQWWQVMNDVKSSLWDWLRFEPQFRNLSKDMFICNWFSFFQSL